MSEVHDTVQEKGLKTFLMEKKYKNTKWLSEEALKIAVKRKEVTGNGEKETYTHLNAEFQRIARSLLILENIHQLLWVWH